VLFRSHSSTASCAAGGTLTTSFDDRDNSGALSAGDVLSLIYSACKDTSTESANGTLAFTIASASSSGSGTSATVQFSGNLDFQQFAATSGTSTATINGSVVMSAAITSTSLQMSLTVGASGLTIASTGTGYSDSITYDPNMQITLTATTSPLSSVVALNGSFTTSSIGGRVTVATVQPITQLGSDAYPSSGQVVVTGASGSKLRITVLSSTQVRLELDANGDGTYETTTDLTWANLRTA